MEVERQKLRAARRLVIKVGTATVTGAEGELCRESASSRSFARLRS